MTSVFLNRIATAVPERGVHRAFVEYAEQMLCDERWRALFRSMVSKSDVEHRSSPLQLTKPTKAGEGDAHDVYIPRSFPSTAQRMRLFERFAPMLAANTPDRLGLAEEERKQIRHVIVTCRIGVYAPGLDLCVIDHVGLAPSTERTMIGFKGCRITDSRLWRGQCGGITLCGTMGRSRVCGVFRERTWRATVPLRAYVDAKWESRNDGRLLCVSRVKR